MASYMLKKGSMSLWLQRIIWQRLETTSTNHNKSCAQKHVDWLTLLRSLLSICQVQQISQSETERDQSLPETCPTEAANDPIHSLVYLETFAGPGCQFRRSVQLWCDHTHTHTHSVISVHSHSIPFCLAKSLFLWIQIWEMS